MQFVAKVCDDSAVLEGLNSWEILRESTNVKSMKWLTANKWSLIEIAKRRLIVPFCCCCLWKILKPTSDYRAIVQRIVSLLIHLWLKTLLTGHWGGPYGGVKAQGSWLSGGHRGNQTKTQPAGPQTHRASMEQQQIPHWGRLPVRFQTEVWSVETGHFNIIRSAIHTPASRVTCSLCKGE